MSTESDGTAAPTTRAIILAAGLGWRLGRGYPPKSLFEFDGHSLLERHVRILASCGVTDIVVGIGYRHHLIQAELDRLTCASIQTVYNPDFHEGNIVTLWHMRDRLRPQDRLLVMDADVLYDRRMIERLLESRAQASLLLDRNCEADDEPVKVWVKDGAIVDFGKLPSSDRTFDFYGESVGFFKFEGLGVSAFKDVMESFIKRGERDALYEEAIRELILTVPEVSAGFEDISGLPWTEIDFHADLDRARNEILPRLERPNETALPS